MDCFWALIAAAAYDASKNAAKTIKVFDTAGSLRYSFTPQGVEAPFTIEIGKFLPGSEYIRQFGYTVDETGTVPYTN